MFSHFRFSVTMLWKGCEEDSERFGLEPGLDFRPWDQIKVMALGKDWKKILKD